MARTRDQQRVYDDLLKQYGKLVADAFFEAVQDLRSAAELRRLITAIALGRLEEAIDALNLDSAAWERVAEAVRSSYVGSGTTTTGLFPARMPSGIALIVRFSPGDPVAAEWLRNHAAALVRRLDNDTREVVRDHLSAGMRAGTNPRRVALDLVGRINRANGRREGGVLGLSGPQAAYVRRAAEELSSADPLGLQNYLTRERRNKRLDGYVRRALESGRPVSAEVRARMLVDYEASLLQLRGETVGRTEAMTALQFGRDEAYRQAIASGKVKADTVTKTWRSARDTRVRFSHASLDGQKRKFGEPFQSPSGAQLQFPMDTSLGAGGEEIINCRCVAEYNIDFFAGLT